MLVLFVFEGSFVVALDDVSRRILEFESKYEGEQGRGGAKAELVYEEFGWSEVRYYQKLNWVLDDPDAVAEFPVLVNRLLRVRDSGSEGVLGVRGQRSGSVLGDDVV